MNKRGQVTLFIVLGLIILLTTSLLFASQSILQTQEKQPKILVPGVDLSLQVYIENCLEKTTIKGTTLLMAQGGYENPLFFVPFQENKAPYYLEYNSDTAFLLSPSKKMMEEELSLYIEKNLESCMQHFAPFAREGIMITENNSLQLQNDILQIPGIQVIVSQPKAEVQIGTDKKITSSLHFPIHIKEGERKKELRDFSISIHSPLAKLHALAQEISEQQRANEMDLSILLDIAEREEISYQLTFINNSHTVIYSLYDLKPQIDEFEKIDFKDKESFNFAVKYHWPEEKFVSESFLIPKSFSLEAKITNNQQKQQQKNYQKQQKPSKTISLSGKAITFLGEEVPQQENSFPTEMISSETAELSG
ncbi:hypothetical protein HYX13_02065 [Candidatus Woesearchaeota archaeon]|nr:hypothetical protein [Candidatus Woesearchaeota archaeon]